MNKKRTILIADDETEIRELLKLYLENDGYNVIEAENGSKAIEQFNNMKIDIAILDIMMAQKNGIDTLKHIRENSNIPVIMLSAKGSDYDRILGLNLGADDYMTKPFNPLEVSARVAANLRRFYKLGSGIEDEEENIQVNKFTLNTKEYTLKIDDQIVELTSTEYKVLLLFMKNPGRVFTKQQIYEAGWEQNCIVDDNSIMVCISKLRHKLNDADNQIIKTIRGLGYRFEK